MEEDYIIIHNEQPKQNPKKILWISLIVISLILVISITVISNIVNRKIKTEEIVEIENYTTFEDNLPQEAKDNLRLSLYYHLFEFFEVPKNEKSIKAVIRENSYEKFEKNNTTTATFIIDIDDYEQTYKAFIAWKDNTDFPMDITIGCPDSSYSKYMDSTCKSSYDISDSIMYYLPYENTISTGEVFTVRQRNYYDGEKYLEIAINSCGDKKILNEALEKTKQWIYSKHINPDTYKYEMPTHYCPGGAS